MFCFKKEIGPLLVTVWDALMDEGPVAELVGGATEANFYLFEL